MVDPSLAVLARTPEAAAAPLALGSGAADEARTEVVELRT